MVTVDLEERLRDLRDAFDRSFAEAPRPPETGFEDLLAVRVGGAPYAVRIAEIDGLFTERVVVALPGPVPQLLGVAAFRGTVVPTYSLGRLLGETAGDEGWLVLASGRPALALAFDGIDGHLRVPAGSIARDSVTSTAVVRAGGATRTVLDLPAVRAVIERLCSTGTTDGSR
jgi:chemotaxis signal transduction protein